MPASIFAGSKVKTLKSTLSLNGGADIISSTTNPQTSAVSAEPGSLLLNTTSGTMYRKLDSGSTTNWVEVGAGTGGKNYIKNPDFDGGATTSWSMQKVSLSSFIPTGNIGAADAGHTIATSGSSPLEGANSLLVQGASAFTAGNCLVSAAFTIDREDVAKVMGWSFAYEAITTNMDFSGTTANTWAVYIAEVTTGTPDTVVSWIQPAGVYNLVQGVGVGLAAGTFQTTATESSAYRIVLVCINSEAAATTLKVDDFQLGPQRVVYGSPVTDWQSFTPTVSGISGTMTGKWRRIGDSAEFEMALTTSGAASGTITVSVTSAFAFDYTKLPVSAFANIGSASVNDGTGLHLGACFTDNTSTNSFFISGDDGQNVWNATVPFTWSGTRTVSFSVRVPLAGLSSSVQMSNDTDTRVVAASVYPAVAQPALISGVVTKVLFDTINFGDTHAAFDFANDWYRVPVSGWYQISATLAFVINNVGARAVGYRIDGTFVRWMTGFQASTADTTRCGGSALAYLNAGSYVEIFAFQNSGSSLTIGVGADNTYFSICRQSGPATIAASETVGCTYDSLAAGTIAPSGTDLIYTNRLFDTHSSYSTSTGEYTVPISGKWTISAQFRIGTTAMTVGFGTALAVKIDNTVTKFIANVRTQTTTGIIKEVSGAPITLQLVAGQKIKMHAFSDTSATIDISGSNNTLFNWVSIMRTGN
jgi:hypothetical protein